MKKFAETPLRLDILFADAPSPSGALWTEACDLENQLAEKLMGMPEGTAVVFSDKCWFLQQRGDVRVLCHAIHVEGILLEFSRFDLGLAYSDVDEDELANYIQLIALATEQFETKAINIPPYVEHSPNTKGV